MAVALKNCPFCGGVATKHAYDRGVNIGCTPCGYSRHFPGLLQTTPNDKPILQYRDGDSVRQLKPDEATEFYHGDAYEKAAEAWNIRSSTSAANSKAGGEHA